MRTTTIVISRGRESRWRSKHTDSGVERHTVGATWSYPLLELPGVILDRTTCWTDTPQRVRERADGDVNGGHEHPRRQPIRYPTNEIFDHYAVTVDKLRWGRILFLGRVCTI